MERRGREEGEEEERGRREERGEEGRRERDEGREEVGEKEWREEKNEQESHLPYLQSTQYGISSTFSVCMAFW